jgi:hypothetical protein
MTNLYILALAMMCVSEISLQPETKECELMWEVNQRTADRRGVNILKQTEDFNAIFSWKTRVKREWVMELNLEGTMPPSWFGGSKSWKRHRVYWLRYLKAAKRFLQHHRPLCLEAGDYGGPADKPKKECYRRVRCLNGQTHQWYWNISGCRRRG